MCAVTGIEKDAPRPGRKPAVGADKVQEIIRKTTQQRPTNATHWSRRTMAKEAGVSTSTVGRLRRALEKVKRGRAALHKVQSA